MSHDENRPTWGIPDGEMRSSIQTLAPQGEREPWGVRDVRGANVVESDLGDSPIVVGILDTGADVDHPDLKGLYLSATDYTNSRSGPADVNGHSTHVAGIIAAKPGNNIGIRGVCPHVRLRSYKVLNDSGSGTDAMIETGFRAAMRECNVINMSLGGDSPMPRLESLIREFWITGGITVCASGNGGNRRTRAIYPAAYEFAVSVGSYDSNGQLSNFSQGDPKIDLYAPGGGIESTFPGGRYTVMSGTSMSAPHVTAIVAEIMRRQRYKSGSYTPQSVLDALRGWCVKDAAYPGEMWGGAGKPRIEKFVSPTPPSPPVPDEPSFAMVRVTIDRGMFSKLATAFADPQTEIFTLRFTQEK